MLSYTVTLSPPIRQQLARLRPAARDEICAGLNQLAEDLAGAHHRATAQPEGPPFRFYAGGMRVFYRADRAERSVVVLELRAAFA